MLFREARIPPAQLAEREIAAGEVLVTALGSGFPIAVMNYSGYLKMKALAETAMRLKLSVELDLLRVKAEEAGLTEEDVGAEVRAVRNRRRG